MRWWLVVVYQKLLMTNRPLVSEEGGGYKLGRGVEGWGRGCHEYLRGEPPPALPFPSEPRRNDNRLSLFLSNGVLSRVVVEGKGEFASDRVLSVPPPVAQHFTTSTTIYIGRLSRGGRKKGDRVGSQFPGYFRSLPSWCFPRGQRCLRREGRSVL